MKKWIVLLLCVVSCFILSNCGISARFASSDTAMVYKQRVSPEEIKVYRSSKPEMPYIEIGSVYACCDSEADVLVKALKQKAAEYGGDAIIDIEPYPDGMSATVIRFK